MLDDIICNSNLLIMDDIVVSNIATSTVFCTSDHVDKILFISSVRDKSRHSLWIYAVVFMLSSSMLFSYRPPALLLDKQELTSYLGITKMSKCV